MGSVFWGWTSNEPAREYAALMRESQTAEEARVYAEGFVASDVSDRLPLIKSPTLVLHHRQATLIAMEAIRALAARIPDARLAIVEGETVAGTITGVEEAAAIDGFLLGDHAAPRAIATGARLAGTAIIMFADIVDSTTITERMGDAAFRQKARALDDALRIAVRDHGGAAIDGKLLGDGILATFPAASQAIAAALACGSAGDAQGLPLHLGLHAGDVIREAGPRGQSNVYGGAVNIASRISALAEPGEVLVSDTVRSLSRTSAGVTFEDRGEHALKGIAEPQRVFAVRRP